MEIRHIRYFLNVPGLAFRPIDKAAPPLSLALACKKHRPPALATNFMKLATAPDIEDCDSEQ